MADSATYREKTGHDIATVQNIDYYIIHICIPNNGHIGDECFVHYSEVVPSSEVLTCIQLLAGGTHIVGRSSALRRFHCIHNLTCMVC